MSNNLIASAHVSIKATPAQVWEALTNPEIIKQYLFGTEAVSNWQIGSSITYTGVWEGKTYEDKGIILDIIPEKKLETSYWSIAYGLPDSPENYKKVTYELEPEGGMTKLTVTQDNNSNEDDRAHCQKNWEMVLSGLKTLLEK